MTSMLVFYFFAAIVIWLGILSLRGGKRFAEYLRLDPARPLPGFTPFVSVIVPTRGLDQGLHENLTALFQQEYPNYEIIFVTDEKSDPSVSALTSTMPPKKTRTNRRLPMRAAFHRCGA